MAAEDHRIILLIEQAADLRELLETILSDEGYAVIPAADLDTAVGLAITTKPNLVVVNSAEVCPGVTQLRPTGKRIAALVTLNTPILLISTVRRVISPLCAQQNNIAGVLEAPFDIDDLLDHVSRALEIRPGKQRGFA